MLAGANVIADCFHDGMIHGRPLIRAERILAQQFVYRPGADGAKKFSAWIGAGIIFGAGNVYGARRSEREKHVSIYRNFIVMIGVLMEISAEPMWEDNIQMSDRLSETPSIK